MKEQIISKFEYVDVGKPENVASVQDEPLPYHLHRIFLYPINRLYKPLLSGAVEQLGPWISDCKWSIWSTRNMLPAE